MIKPSWHKIHEFSALRKSDSQLRGLSWCWGAPVAAISPRTHPAGMVTAFRFIVLSYVAGKNHVGTPKITAIFDDFWIVYWCLLMFIDVYCWLHRFFSPFVWIKHDKTIVQLLKKRTAPVQIAAVKGSQTTPRSREIWICGPALSV